jgi:serine/threonine-protein kinase RsbW
VKTLSFAADLSEMDDVRRFLKDHLHAIDLSEEDFFKIELAVVEMCINIIRYAYPEEPGLISLSLGEGRERIVIELRDSGVPFDPCTAPKPDVKEIMAAGRKGGLGIYLTRKLMDSCDYRRKDGQNILTMIKKV